VEQGVVHPVVVNPSESKEEKHEEKEEEEKKTT